MNQQLIEQLIEECTEYWTDKGDIYFDKKKFAALVAAAEREACAKVCDEVAESRGDADECATEIRARGETK